MERTAWNLAGTVIAAILILAGGAKLHAQAVTWTGTTSTWVNGDGTNWTGGDGIYNDGDAVIFPNSGVSSFAVDVSGIVSPGDMSFDTSGGTYTLRNGALGGSGALTKVDAGLLQINSVGTTSPIDMSVYSGDVNINGGTLLLRYIGADLTVGLGTGTVNINNGTLHLGHSGVWNTPVNFTNDVTIGSGGGTVNVASISNRQVLRLSGQWTLNGDLTWTGPASYGDGNVRGPNMDHPFIINTDVSITNNIENHAYTQQFMLSGLNAGGLYDVTYAGNSMPLPADPANLQVKNLYVEDAAFTPSQADDATHYLGAPGMTGQVIVKPGGALTLRDGTHTLGGTLQVQTGGELNLVPNGWQSLTLTDSIVTIGTSGLVPTLPLNQTQSGVRIGNASGTLVIADGGTFDINGSNQKHYFGGHIRLLDGGTLDITHGSGVSDTLAFQLYDHFAPDFGLSRTTGNLYLGDGDPNTKETVTIKGRHNVANADGTFAISVQNTKFLDDGGVTLRYESPGQTADEWFNFGWTTATGQSMYQTRMPVNSQFRGGSEGTEFAPSATGNGIAAVGPDSGTVFTVTSAASLVTEGTVGFYNSVPFGSTVGGQRAAFGPVTVAAGGSFDLLAAGTVQADSITVQSGGSIGGIGTFEVLNGIALSGDITPGNSIGTATISGDLTMASGGALVIETGANDQSDLLQIAGTLDITDGELVLEALGSWYTGSFVIATYETLLGSEFAAITNNTGRRLLSIDYLTDSSISVMLVPEPASAALMGLAAVILLHGRRRRR